MGLPPALFLLSLDFYTNLPISKISADNGLPQFPELVPDTVLRMASFSPGK